MGIDPLLVCNWRFLTRRSLSVNTCLDAVVRTLVCVFSAHSILENVLENVTWEAEVKTSNRDRREEKPNWV